MGAMLAPLVPQTAELIAKNGIENEINPRRIVPSLDRFHTPRQNSVRQELSNRRSERKSGSSFSTNPSLLVIV